MLSYVLNFLKHPYPFIFNIYSVVIPAVVTFLLIVFLAPLDFATLDFKARLVVAVSLTIIVALSILIGVKSLKYILPKYMDEERWTLGKEISLWCFVLTLISLAISIALITATYYQEQSLPPFLVLGQLFFDTLLLTLGISTIPMLVLLLFEQNQYQKQQIKKADLLNNKLNNRIKKEDQKSQPISFYSEKGVLELKLEPNDILYIKSDGNYIEVFYKNVNTIEKKLIRARLKIAATNLPSSLFFRCHNRFIVNGTKIIKVEGNARNLSLYLKDIKASIPVSRSKANEVSGFLDQIS